MKGENLKLKIAYVISRLSDVFLWFVILGLSVVFSGYLDGYNRLGYAVGLLVILGVLPVIVLWFGLKKGKIKDIDFTDRKERTPYMMIVLFFWLIGFFLSWSYGAPQILLVLLFIVIAIGIVVLIINLFWKVSNHSLTITAVSVILNQLFDWQYTWLFVLIPIVSWSRYVQKKHTILQLVGGFVIGIAAWLLLILFGY